MIKEYDLKKIKNKAKIIIKKLDKLFPKANIALNFSNPWELFIAVVLSARNKDEIVNKITEKLFKKYKSLDDYVKANEREFAKDINKLGLYKQKAKFILTAAKIIKNKYSGRIPDTIEELITLPGIGRKSANIILWQVYKKAEGFPVDTHIRRLSRLFGLTNNSDPDKIEQDLIKVIPKNRWGDLPYKFIEYGRKYCPARCKHINCPLKDLIIKTKN
ncbi:MAG: endonuclease III [Candidatus Parcubacteria bacterium]|nr:MAG: endonuclease III [Candidatus Parcubacteria bacterium]